MSFTYDNWIAEQNNNKLLIQSPILWPIQLPQKFQTQKQTDQAAIFGGFGVRTGYIINTNLRWALIKVAPFYIIVYHWVFSMTMLKLTWSEVMICTEITANQFGLCIPDTGASCHKISSGYPHWKSHGWLCNSLKMHTSFLNLQGADGRHIPVLPSVASDS